METHAPAPPSHTSAGWAKGLVREDPATGSRSLHRSPWVRRIAACLDNRVVTRYTGGLLIPSKEDLFGAL